MKSFSRGGLTLWTLADFDVGFVIADLHRAPPVWRQTPVEMCRPRSLGNTTPIGSAR